MLRLLLAAVVSLAQATTIISTFSDASCQDSLRSLDGPNGYPNGTCTPLATSGTYDSFQLVGIDPGCEVTAYQANTDADVCSGFPFAIEVATCYNSSWIYYSIDNCNAAAVQSSSLTSASASASATNNSSNNVSAKSTNHTGAIAGGVVGGVVGLALVLGGVFLYLRKKKAKTNASGAQEMETPIAELPGQKAAELGGAQHDAVYEKVAEGPPVELPGSEVKGPSTTEIGRN